MTDTVETHPARKPCPVCGKPGQDKFLPFCSKRCADVDLNRWLSGNYRVETDEKEGEDGLRDGG